VDSKQQTNINEAAEKFADALRDSYQIVADRTVSAQQLNAEITQSFFNEVIGSLRRQADANRSMTEELVNQQQRQREATQAITQESVNAYMDFLNSFFSYYQGNVEAARAQMNQARPGGTGA
jgi:uncharacterized protein YktB (UPF0637 family)